MPEDSPFGDTRLVIPVAKLLTGNWNLYFADFYCHSRKHYVALVLTRQGSRADDFCAAHLIGLSFSDKKGNPFFYCDLLSKQYYCNTKVRVEILYTENINVKHELQADPECLYSVRTIFAGTSTVFGKPKNSDCHICNLHFTKK